MNCNVTAEEFQAFLDNKSDQLVNHVGVCDACQRRLESEASKISGVTEGTMRAVRAHRTGTDVAQLILDLGSRYVAALANYTGRAS